MKKTLFSFISLMLIVVMLGGCLTGCIFNSKEKTPAKLDPQPAVEDPGNPVTYKVSGAISSNMVLQQNKYIHIWGFSDNIGAYMYGEFMGETRYAQVDENGVWDIEFSAHPYTTEPQTLKVYPKNGTETVFNDILIGDVWIVAGQSNAELRVMFTESYSQETLATISESDNIRLYFQNHDAIMYGSDTIDLTVPQEDVIDPEYCWKKTDKETVYNFSAIGYYFAKEVSRNTDIPLGLINTAVGGQPLRQFISNELYAEIGGVYEEGASHSRVFNAFTYPFLRMPIRGMLFYQGESDNWTAGNWDPEMYSDHFEAFAKEQRELYGYDFPILNVQLSSHPDTDWDGIFEIRNEQVELLSKVDNYYLVTSFDKGWMSGAGVDVAHPQDKEPIGKRLAAVALAEIYGEGSLKNNGCPVPVKADWKDDKVVVTFDNVGRGLTTINNEPLNGFYLLNENMDVLSITKAEITGKNKVTITLKENLASQTAYVAYAPDDVANPIDHNLINSNEMPAVAFAFKK